MRASPVPSPRSLLVGRSSVKRCLLLSCFSLSFTAVCVVFSAQKHAIRVRWEAKVFTSSPEAVPPAPPPPRRHANHDARMLRRNIDPPGTVDASNRHASTMEGRSAGGTAVTRPPDDGRPLCGIRSPAIPSESTAVPWVWDVFASDHFTRAYFIAHDATRCYEHYNADVHNFHKAIFMCEFSVVGNGTITRVASANLRKTHPNSGAFAIWCPIPVHIQPHVNNTDNRASVIVNLVTLKGLRQWAQIESLDGVGLCGNAVVNEGKVEVRTNRKGERRHTVVGMTHVTGEKYQVNECMEALRSTADGRRACTDDTHLPRVKEWLDYHFMVGMDHFYVYDNSPQPFKQLWEVVKPYVDAGRVTYIPWPFKSCLKPSMTKANFSGELRVAQHMAELSALRRFGEDTEWFISFDVDEFIIPAGRQTDIPTALRSAAKTRGSVVDAFSLKPVYYGVCDPTDFNISPPEPGASYFEHMKCRGTASPWYKTKQFIRPNKVHEHTVHYSITDARGRVNAAIESRMFPNSELWLAHMRSVRYNLYYSYVENDPIHAYWPDRLKRYRDSPGYVLNEGGPAVTEGGGYPVLTYG